MKLIQGKTFNRGKLKRDIQKGLIVGKCNGKYTDDYRTDYENNYSIGKEYIKVIVFPNYHKWVEDKETQREEIKAQYRAMFGQNTDVEMLKEFANKELLKQYHKERKEAQGYEPCITLEDYDFSNYGRAYVSEKDTICLSFGSYLSYNLQYKK